MENLSFGLYVHVLHATSGTCTLAAYIPFQRPSCMKLKEKLLIVSLATVVAALQLPLPQPPSPSINRYVLLPELVLNSNNTEKSGFRVIKNLQLFQLIT